MGSKVSSVAFKSYLSRKNDFRLRLSPLQKMTITSQFHKIAPKVHKVMNQDL